MKKLLADRVLVKPTPDVVKSSVLHTIQVAKNPIIGHVVEVGDGFKDVEMTVQQGDRVLFGRSSGYTDPKLLGENIMMKMIDIIAILDEDVNVTMK
jgi:co-chaperonin GroES (HSP10)